MIHVLASNSLIKTTAVGVLGQHGIKKQAGGLSDVGEAVQVLISEEGKLLNQKEKKPEGKTSAAAGELMALDAEEKDRQEKLERIDELTEELENGNLSEEDKKVIGDEIEKLKEETKTKDDEISEYQKKLSDLEKDGEVDSERCKFYRDEILRLKDDKAREAAHRSALIQQVNQEQADAANREIKEKAEGQAKGFEAAPNIVDAVLLKEMAKRETSLLNDIVEDKEERKGPAADGVERDEPVQKDSAAHDVKQDQAAQDNPVKNGSEQEQKD